MGMGTKDGCTQVLGGESGGVRKFLDWLDLRLVLISIAFLSVRLGSEFECGLGLGLGQFSYRVLFGSRVVNENQETDFCRGGQWLRGCNIS